MGSENLTELTTPKGDSRSARGTRFPVRLFARLAVAAWVLVLLLSVGYVALVHLLGEEYCEVFEGSSIFENNAVYGELRWSALPPGPTCTFTKDVHGFDEVRGPYSFLSIWLGALVVGGALCIAVLRRLHQPEGTGADGPP